MDTPTPSARIIQCPACGAKNRVPIEQVERGLQPICGRCKRPLPPVHAPMVVTDATFSEIVEHSPLPVLVDIWAPWCGPCRLIAPIIDELAAEMAGRVRFAKLNADENPRTSARFHIEGIPALLIFKDGREVDRLVGAHPKPEIARHLHRVLG